MQPPLKLITKITQKFTMVYTGQGCRGNSKQNATWIQASTLLGKSLRLETKIIRALQQIIQTFTSLQKWINIFQANSQNHYNAMNIDKTIIPKQLWIVIPLFPPLLGLFKTKWHLYPVVALYPASMIMEPFGSKNPPAKPVSIANPPPWTKNTLFNVAFDPFGYITFAV